MRVAEVQIILVHFSLLSACQDRQHTWARDRIEQRQQAAREVHSAVLTSRHGRLETLGCLLTAGERYETDRLE